MEKYITEIELFLSIKAGKTRGKKYLKSNDGFLIHKLTTTATLANKAVDIGAYLLSPEKIIVRFQNLFPS